MRFNMGVGALTAMMLSGGPELIPNFDQPHEHGRRRNKPSGSKPVAGGGARERARRLAKMQAAEEQHGQR